MIDAGARAYLLKDCSQDQMVNTLLTVHETGSFYNSFVVEKLMEYQKNSEQNELSNLDDAFSEREIEYIKLCCTELTNKEIADGMFLSTKTVSTYKTRLLLKLNARSLVDLIELAQRNGLV